MLFSNLFVKNVVQDLTSAGSSDTDSFMEELKELAKGAIGFSLLGLCREQCWISEKVQESIPAQLKMF